MSTRLTHSDSSFGTPSECRHREAVFQQLSADLMLGASDLSSLAAAAGRAMNHVDVRRDGLLAGMVRGCVAAREAELRAKMAEHLREEALADAHAPHPVQAPSVWQTPPAAAAAATKAHAIASFERLRHEYDERVAHFELERAAHWLQKIDELQRRYPDDLAPAAVQRCRLDFARLEQKRQQLLEEIDRLAHDAATAAAAGHMEAAAQSLRRLSAMQAARPQVLPLERLEQIRGQITAASETFDRREATHALLEREKAVAGEIRALAESVHRFHLVAREIPPDDARYQAAEADYRRTIRQLRWHDKDWLADLMIELDEMLERLHDPTGRAEAQVGQFLASVRSALSHAVKEAREIATETAGTAAGR